MGSHELLFEVGNVKWYSGDEIEGRCGDFFTKQQRQEMFPT
jgi:hypothetical protein